MRLPKRTYLKDDTSALEEIVVDRSALNTAAGVEHDSDQFTKSGRVIIPDGLCITECFQNRIGRQNCLRER